MFITSIMFCLVSCGGTNASDKAISVGKKALGITDDYLDKSISADSARTKLDALKADMEYVGELEHGVKNKAADFSVQTSLLSLSTYILSDSVKNNDESYANILKSRNNLAKTIGERKR